MSTSGKGSKPAKPGSAQDRRDRAAAARAAQEAADKRRDRLIKIIGSIAVLVVVGLIIGGALLGRNSGGESASTAVPTPDPTAAAPAGVETTGDFAYAVPYGTGSASAPTLSIWEDFQCPACGAVEEANGAHIQELAKAGTVRLYYRPTAFLDANLVSKNQAAGAPISSHRAIAAWGCAIDAGKTAEFHNLVYANQPAEEGTGFTEAQLLEFGKQAGIEGDAYTTFESCVKDGTYMGWAANSYKAFNDAAIPGTPAAFLNGTEIGSDVLADAAKLDALIAEAAKK